MANSMKAATQSVLALLAVLLAAGGCGTPGDLPGATPRAEEMGIAGATAGCPDLFEAPDVKTANAATAETVKARTSNGESLEGVYVITLTECLYAGRLTFQDQKVRLIRQEGYSSWAALDGRFEDATPVRIKGEDVGELRTRVLFTVGTRKSEYNMAKVRALKEGFERRLLVATPRDP